MQQINFVPQGFCRITMAGKDFRVQSRAKNTIIVPMTETTTKATHQLRFYDCSCGSIRQISGKIIENEEERIVFRVNEGKKFILEKIKRPKSINL
jgi:exopolysaccharide biosynthesis protein